MIKYNTMMYFIFLPLLLIPFSPFISYFLTLFLIFVFSRSSLTVTQSNLIFIIYGFNLVLSLSFYSLGYRLFSSYGHDFTDYYNNYILLSRTNDLFSGLEYGAGFEVFLPFFNYLLSRFLGEYPYRVFLFHVITINLLFLCVIYFLSKRKVFSSNNSLLFLGFMFLFFKYAPVYITLRQTYASLFIILSYACVSKAKSYACLFMAVTCHLSSLIIAPFVLFILNNNRGGNFKSVLLAVVLFVVTLLLFVSDGNFLTMVLPNDYFLGKFTYYYSVLSSFNNLLVFNLIPMFNYLVFFILLFLIYSFSLLFARNVKSDEYFFKLFSIIIFSLSLMLFPFSYRFFHPVYYFMIGYFVYFSPVRFSLGKFFVVKLSSIFYIAFFVFYFNSWLRIPDNYYNFPLMSSEPFYYLDILDNKNGGVDRTNLPNTPDFSDNNNIIF